MAQAHSAPPDHQDPAELLDAMSAADFDCWYREREFRRNIEQGTPYFNGPRKPQPATRHSPSRLLKCHRQTYYQQRNAPEETADPNGIFWVGSRFEEDIIVPFLREAVAGENEYVTNSLWIDFTVATDAGELRIKGETDPVIVTSEYEPILLTEIKTKDSLEHTSEPNRHHRAQVHAYMKGLSEKHDQNVSEAVILYASRKTLDVQPFHVEFDPWFWRQTVLNWAETNTTYRLREELPPADPEYDWECSFCAYRERCGKGDSDHGDLDPIGLLPNFVEYPREKLVEYLRAQEEAKLTPVLAHLHPDLVRQYGVLDWKCRGCGAKFEWDEVEFETSSSSKPLCPSCVQDGRETTLTAPQPSRQAASDNQE